MSMHHKPTVPPTCTARTVSRRTALGLLWCWLVASMAWGHLVVGCTTGVLAADADVLLKNGTIYDGTGGPSRLGDVAIRGDRIVAVGSFSVGNVGRVVDCTGLVIAPGFIDLHTHSDRSITKDGTRVNLNYLRQGCTTVVTGKCGLSPDDTKKYFDEIDRAGAGTNIIHLVGHGPVRRAGMNNAKRPPTPDELKRMKGIVAGAMRLGAWGFSTGLIYDWSCYGGTDKLVELA